MGVGLHQKMFRFDEFIQFLDQYESDSLTSDHNLQQSVYAEVLFPFEPVGDQELALEKGALVEIIRCDPGPWWWGRIKHDEIIASIISEQQQGWFPKDFVRVSVDVRNCDKILVIKFPIFSLDHSATSKDKTK